MIPQRSLWARSVGGAVLLTLVCANTLLLAVLGAFDYIGEKRRLERDLRYDLKVALDQLAASLDAPLWHGDRTTVVHLVEGAMRDDCVAAVLVTEPDTGALSVGRTRDRGWLPAPVSAYPALDNVIGDRREIRFEGTPIGVVEVFVSRSVADRERKVALARIVLRILSLNVALALAVALVVRWRIVNPLARLERYAARVTLGDENGEEANLGRLYGELDSLGRAMEAMVRRISSTQRRYRDICEHATEGILQTTLDGRIVSANAALAGMLGYDSPRELMESVTDIGRQAFHKAEDWRLMVERLEAEGRVSGFQTRFNRRGGQTVWMLLNVRLVRDDAGLPLYAEGTLSDISARMRAERRLEVLNRHLSKAVRERTRRLAEKAVELEAANVRLKELDSLKSGFLATVSHDLRTPLTSIMGFAKLISRDFRKYFAPLAKNHDRLSRLAERIASNLAIIEGEGERLTRLINDFLDLSKIEAGRAEWRDAPVDVAAIVARAADAVCVDLQAKPGVAFSMELAPDLPPLFMDQDRLSQILVNLLGNAVKFTDEGGVRLKAAVAGDMLRVEVADTGQGVPRESLEKIFDKFHQAEAGDTVEEGRRRKGTGLGLAICRQIVEHYDGRIWAESELGRGSTFIMELPLAGELPRAS